MTTPHSATAALAFQLTANSTSPETVEALVRKLCDGLEIECNSRLLDALAQPALGQQIDELIFKSVNGLLECEPWDS